MGTSRAPYRVSRGRERGSERALRRKGKKIRGVISRCEPRGARPLAHGVGTARGSSVWRVSTPWQFFEKVRKLAVVLLVLRGPYGRDVNVVNIEPLLRRAYRRDNLTRVQRPLGPRLRTEDGRAAPHTAQLRLLAPEVHGEKGAAAEER